MLPPGKAAPKNANREDHEMHSQEACLADRELYAMNFKAIETESNRVKARRLLQPRGTGYWW